MDYRDRLTMMLGDRPRPLYPSEAHAPRYPARAGQGTRKRKDRSRQQRAVGKLQRLSKDGTLDMGLLFEVDNAASELAGGRYTAAKAEAAGIVPTDETIRVKQAGVISQQRLVQTEKVAGMIENGLSESGPVTMIRRGSQLMIDDGHHRTTRAHLLDETIPVKVYDVPVHVELTYRERLLMSLGDRSKYPGGLYPSEQLDEKGQGVLPAGVQDRLRELGHSKDSIDKMGWNEAMAHVAATERRTTSSLATPADALPEDFAQWSQNDRNAYHQKIRSEEHDRLKTPMRRSADRMTKLADALDAWVAEHPEDAINLPDISDVSFPSMAGAMPSKPPKKKAKKKRPVNYGGVMLGRMPTEFEARVLSLTAIPRRYDLELAAVVDRLAAVRQRHVEGLLRNDRSAFQIRSAETAREETERILTDVQDRMARYGLVELRNECRRQGLALDDLPEEDASFEPFLDGLGLLQQSVRLTADTLHRDWLTTLDRTALRVHRSRRGPEEVRALAEPKIEFGLKSAGRQLLHEAFCAPRREYMRVLSSSVVRDAVHLKKVDPDNLDELVDYVIQTAVMDLSTCDPCAEIDGEIYDYDDPEVEENAPPYVRCLGGDNCRCVQVYVLKDGSSYVVRAS